MDTVVVLAAGPGLPPGASLPPGAFVIAADGGAEHARALGVRVDLAVGDFDSVSEATLAALEHDGARLERHPTAKDATDLELALDAALARSPRRILVVAGAGGRLDHLVGGLLLLGAPAYEAIELDALVGSALVHVVRVARVLAGHVGETLSLLALGGPATGIVTDGLAYPLRGETLWPGSSRGVSNEFAAAEARVTLESGVLLAIRPSTAAATLRTRRE